MDYVKEGSYITIQSFMRNELKLEKTELLTYAIIWGFSQKEGSCYLGNLDYIASWVGCSKKQVRRTLNSLIKKGVIIKRVSSSSGHKICKYYAIRKTQGQNSQVDKMSLGQDSIESKVKTPKWTKCPSSTENGGTKRPSGGTKRPSEGTKRPSKRDKTSLGFDSKMCPEVEEWYAIEAPYNIYNKYNNKDIYSNVNIDVTRDSVGAPFIFPSKKEVIDYSKLLKGYLYLNPEKYYEQRCREGWIDKRGLPITSWKCDFIKTNEAVFKMHCGINNKSISQVDDGSEKLKQDFIMRQAVNECLINQDNTGNKISGGK